MKSKIEGASNYEKIENCKDLILFISNDMKRMGGGIFVNPLRWIIGEDNARMRVYLIVLRLCEYFCNVRSHNIITRVLATPLYLLFFVWHRRQCFKYTVHIALNQCDYGLRIAHPGCIHINAEHVGKNCSVNQGVVLGKKGTGRPYLGDNVQFTIGSKAIGDIKIGNNTVVCPNSVVIKDLPANVIASGVPVNIIKQRRI